MPSPFATTSWATIVAARDAPSTESRRALEALCRTYWCPVYAFVRRQGHDGDDARDLTQAYFATLLEKGYTAVSPSSNRSRAENAWASSAKAVASA